MESLDEIPAKRRKLGDSDREGKPLYFDVNATTPLAPTVVDVISKHLKDTWGNPCSGHVYGVAARQVVEDARANVAGLIKAATSDIVFTSGGTEANNLIFHSVVQDHRRRHQRAQSVLGDKPHVVISAIEHDSVALPLRHLVQESVIQLTEVLPCSGGFVTAEDIGKALTPSTILVSIMLANNETGVIQPVQEISRVVAGYARQRQTEIYVHTDAAQALGKVPVDVKTLEVDYLTIVGHKFYGPRIGALYTRDLGQAQAAPLFPMFFGGGQERNYRSGTENTAMIAGLGEAARLVNNHLEEYSKTMSEARNEFESLLEAEFGYGGISFNGRGEREHDRRLPNTSNFSVLGDGLEGWKLLEGVSGFVASLGAACHSDTEKSASGILLKSGVPEPIAKNAMRFSVGRETTLEDVRFAAKEIIRVSTLLKKSSTH